MPLPAMIARRYQDVLRVRLPPLKLPGLYGFQNDSTSFHSFDSSVTASAMTDVSACGSP